MIYIESKYLPPKGFQAMSLFGICIHRKDAAPMCDTDFIHEDIHARQQSETQTLCFIVSLIMCVFFPSIWWFISALLFHVLLYAILSVIYGIIGWIKLKSFKSMIKSQYYYYKNPLELEAYSNESNYMYLANRTPFSWFKYIKD